MTGRLDKLETIRLIAFDVDGVFTDGRFYLSDDGVETKAFHTQDGYGVRRLLDAGIAAAVISGRSSGAVEKRMAELRMPHVILGCKNKVTAMDELANELGLSLDECAFVGDDLPDMPLLERVDHPVADRHPHRPRFGAVAGGAEDAEGQVLDREVALGGDGDEGFQLGVDHDLLSLHSRYSQQPQGRQQDVG